MSDVGAVRAYVVALGPWRDRFVALVLASPSLILAALLWQEGRPALLTVTALLIERMLLPATILSVLSLAMILIGSWPVARLGALLAGGLSLAAGYSAYLAIHPPIDFVGVTITALTVLGGVGLVYLGARSKLKSWQFRIPPLAAIIAGMLALLPILQFWHAASFIPSRLGTTLGAKVSADAVSTPRGARGVIQVAVTNSGDVGALVLASELVVCQLARPRDPQPTDVLYGDPECVTERVLRNLSEVDAHSTWEFQSTIDMPKNPPARTRIVEVTVLLWYARQDRLKIGGEIALPKTEKGKVKGCGQGPDDVPTAWRVLDDSRAQGAAQRPRRLVYLRQRDAGDSYFALQAQGEAVCNSAGLPADSKYPLEDTFGLKDLRLNYEAWLPDTPTAGE